MAKRFTIKKLLFLLLSSGIVCVSPSVSASVYQLWEQDGASVGNYHAGRAASAEDASIAYYNPAGLVKIKNQQLVIGVDPIATDIIYRGTINVATAGVGTVGATPASAQGGGLTIVPDLNYAAPISDRFVFGFSIVKPFGLNTSYGTQSFTRYAATLSELQVVDFTPSLGVSITDKFSIGAGLDIERASAEFDLAGGNSNLQAVNGSNADTYQQNTGGDHAYGFRLGALYQFTPATRVGLAYNSKVVDNIHGTSQLYGPLANNSTGGTQVAGHFRTRLILPATTTLSAFHTINPKWDLMGTVILTQWSAVRNLTLNNVAAQIGGVSSNAVTVSIPQQYKNTWNYSVGANYHANQQWMWRAGIGFDQSPVNNQNRTLQIPDNNRIAVAVGTHYQASKALGLDAGWTHQFIANSTVNNTLVVGDQSTQAQGKVYANTDIFGFQLRWDFL